MKPNIHPQYFSDVHVVCACGNKFITGSTKQSISVEVCSKCHPFYTGEHRFLDAKGRVEKFQKKQQVANQLKQTLANKKTKITDKEERQPKTLKELLGESN